MKKILLSAALIAGSMTAMAQAPTMIVRNNSGCQIYFSTGEAPTCASASGSGPYSLVPGAIGVYSATPGNVFTMIRLYAGWLPCGDINIGCMTGLPTSGTLPAPCTPCGAFTITWNFVPPNILVDVF